MLSEPPVTCEGEDDGEAGEPVVMVTGSNRAISVKCLSVLLVDNALPDSVVLFKAFKQCGNSISPKLVQNRSLQHIPPPPPGVYEIISSILRSSTLLLYFVPS